MAPELVEAFRQTPRHTFAPRFPDGRPGLWSDVDDASLLPQLRALYADRPFCIYRDEEGEVRSTMSQPSLVLFMLDLLELKSGETVFELGGGSGWNAALIGQMVGPTGKVVSVEIIETLLLNAQAALDQHGLGQVSLVSGDGSAGSAAHSPFDKGIFTAAAETLPHLFFEQIREGGTLVFVWQFQEASDLLVCLERREGVFESALHLPCRFVPVVGQSTKSWLAQSPEETEFLDQIARQKLDFDELDLRIHANADTILRKSEHWLYRRGECIFEWRRRAR